MCKYFYKIIFVIIAPLTANGQSTPVNFTGWYGYEGYHPFKEGKPWGFFGEGYIKRNDVIIDRMQEFLRIGINYSLKNGNRITGGFAYQYNVPYDEVSEPYDWEDYRIWEQYMIRKPKANGMWVHRFRMEQRWLERKSDPALAETDELKFENTFRYLLRRTFTLNPKVYAILYDEVHLRMPPPDLEKVFDQNRVYAGLGFNLDKHKWWRIETGIMYQSVFNSSVDVDGRKRINIAYRLSLTSDAPFRK